MKRRFYVVLLLLSCYLYFFNNHLVTVYQVFQSQRLKALISSLADDPRREGSEVSDNVTGWLLDNPRCRIPALNPFDPLVMKYITKADAMTVDCAAKSAPQLVKSNLTSLYVDPTAFAHYNVSDIDQLSCCYRPFWRIGRYPRDSRVRYAQICIRMRNEAILEFEFVKVECLINGKINYTDYYAFTPLKQTVENKCEESETNEIDALSVLVLGIDSMSRLQFHRQMPFTGNLLRKLDAVEMLGYTKVADNTFPNMVPLLTGLTEYELKDVCSKSRLRPFDSCPWLWKNYSAHGYRTAFAEDIAVGMFNFERAGFLRQPTDYYLRPYNKEYNDNAGHSYASSCNICYGPRTRMEVLLEYASKFIRTMGLRRYFGFFWSASISHDFLIYPCVDTLYESTLRELVAFGALNRTVLIVMSDHGWRHGSLVSKTYQGRLEERLPLLSFVFPAWFQQKYSNAIANLRINSNRLTSPFDIHATLLDLLNPSVLQKESLLKRINENNFDLATGKEVSLFLPISTYRTCTQARIGPQWCTCHQSRPVALQSMEVNTMALCLVKYLNHILKPYSACAQLRLLSVHRAHTQIPVADLKDVIIRGFYKYYNLIVLTTPGNALFDATLLKAGTKISVVNTVSRVNEYGNQSACVSDPQLKLYCFCNSNISK